MPLVNEDGTLNITQEQYNVLKLNSDKLHALEAAGVDNWEGYDIAMDEFAKENLKRAELENTAKGTEPHVQNG